MDAGDIDPVSIFLVKKGGGGDRLLFRYPYSVPQRKNKPIASGTSNLQQQQQQQQQRNPYALTPQMLAREVSPSAKSNKTQDTLKAETLPAFSSKVLSNLFAAHPGLCGEKFELKISEVRFIGHPMSLEIDPQEARYFANKSKSPLTMFHVVFALRATAPYSVVECYHDLSQQIGAAIRNEERRVGYLTAEAKTMANAQDEVASMPEDKRVSPFELAQDRAQLAQDLKEIYESMRYSGSVYRRINKYIEVNFCIPQKVFHKLNPCLNVDPEAIFDCLEFLKPYHTFLLLYEPKDLLNQLPLDGSPPLYKLVRSADPTMSFRALASDTMIPLRHVSTINPIIFSVREWKKGEEGLHIHLDGIGVHYRLQHFFLIVRDLSMFFFKYIFCTWIPSMVLGVFLPSLKQFVCTWIPSMVLGVFLPSLKQFVHESHLWY